MTEQRKILFVEDNASFRNAMRDYFLWHWQEPCLTELTANFDDYCGIATYLDVHEEEIRKSQVNGKQPIKVNIAAIVDCFFPELRETDRFESGKQAIELMRSSDPNYEKKSQNPATKALTKVGDLLGGKAAKHIGNNLHAVTYNQIVDPYKALEWAIKDDPNNQPLGVLVADRLEQLDVPFVLATSTYHHDELTQPIQDYCSRRGWSLIDCEKDKPEGKATPEYWARVFTELDRRIKETYGGGEE